MSFIIQRKIVRIQKQNLCFKTEIENRIQKTNR